MPKIIIIDFLIWISSVSRSSAVNHLRKGVRIRLEIKVAQRLEYMTAYFQETNKKNSISLPNLGEPCSKSSIRKSPRLGNVSYKRRHR